MPDAVRVLNYASDMLLAARALQESGTDDQIREALRLLNASNPRLVHWVLYTLADVYERAAAPEDGATP